VTRVVSQFVRLPEFTNSESQILTSESENYSFVPADGGTIGVQLVFEKKG